ncbi:MAG TPA: carboxypeptidase-like regulatory domain-containing protein [Bryobacteraceae bacterium]|nr:carboxypeptidase-like regulatory domain-containing protein [Bryobacteraceae bacterium]
MRKRPTFIGFAIGVLVLAAAARTPALAGTLAGGILGQVRNSAGVAQMGATVLLYDRYDQLVRRALTTEDGKFAFAELPPSLYSLRVTLASFVPALRRNISVSAGSENLLQIRLANLFSTVDLVSSGPSRGLLLSDDWKWVLRSSSETRPVLRMLPPSNSQTTATASSIFSGTTGLLRVSAGDGESFTAGGQEDLGTAFAVATSIYGTSRLQLSGNVGYVGNSTIPAAGIRATYSHDAGGVSGPQVTLTVRQLYMPERDGVDNAPAMRTMALALRDSIDLTDDLHLEYGMSTESVTFLERLTYLSPFARATYDLGKHGAVRVAYSDGEQPAAFAAPAPVSSSEMGTSTAALNNDLEALALLPQISRRDDHMQVQRTQSVEAGYERVEGSRKFSASVYGEAASNAALMLAGPKGFVGWTDSLPDLGSNDRIFNIGSYSRVGYTGAVKQALGDHAEVSLAGGYTGSLGVDARDATLQGDSGNDLRSVIHEVARPWAAVNFSDVLPFTGTVLTTSYGYTDPGTLMPDHYYMTQDVMQSTGWNVRIRQPLPVFGGLGGRLEATAELRNLLAQGYLPLQSSGQKALLTNCPRAVRGGLAFIF